MKPKPLSPDQVQNTLTSAIMDAVDFIESEIAPKRLKAQKYFDGRVDLPVSEGRSKVVATKCRDTVRAIKPALMRVFLQSGKPVEFVPNRPDAVAMADQQTGFARYIFEQNDGFKLMHGAFHDALVKKVGVLKAYYDETPEVQIKEFTGQAPEQVEMLRSDPSFTILEEETEIEAVIGPGGMAISPPVMRVRAAMEKPRGRIVIDAVAPEDFFVDRNARNIEDCYVCGHSTETRVGEVVAMGFDFEEVFQHAGSRSGTVDDAEQMERTGYAEDDSDESVADPSMRKILLTEAYMRMDIEGVGVPKLYKFIAVGDSYHILDYDLCEINPFAIYEVDPEPHTFFGRSLVDIIIDDQDAATSLLRGLLDNIQMQNNPRLEVVDSAVNMDDLLNNEIGGIIRVKAMGQIRELVVGQAGSAALSAIDYYNNEIRAKTGVLGAGMGLDPDALQNQTATGARMMDAAVSAVADLIARTLAEGGHKRLFRIIAQLARQHPDQMAMMRVNGQFVPVDPRSWSVDMDMSVNVGLGTNKGEEKAMVLREILQQQMIAVQTYGPINPIAGLDRVFNTLADMLELAGLHNTTRYFGPITEDVAAALSEPAPQETSATDPSEAFLIAEGQKVSARVQADYMKTMADLQKAQMQDDRERDRMVQDLAVEAAKLAANTGVRIDQNAIKREQAMTQPVAPNGF